MWKRICSHIWIHRFFSWGKSAEKLSRWPSTILSKQWHKEVLSTANHSISSYEETGWGTHFSFGQLVLIQNNNCWLTKSRMIRISSYPDPRYRTIKKRHQVTIFSTRFTRQHNSHMERNISDKMSSFDWDSVYYEWTVLMSGGCIYYSKLCTCSPGTLYSVL